MAPHHLGRTGRRIQSQLRLHRSRKILLLRRLPPWHRAPKLDQVRYFRPWGGEVVWRHHPPSLRDSLRLHVLPGGSRSDGGHLPRTQRHGALRDASHFAAHQKAAASCCATRAFLHGEVLPTHQPTRMRSELCDSIVMNSPVWQYCDEFTSLTILWWIHHGGVDLWFRQSISTTLLRWSMHKLK